MEALSLAGSLAGWMDGHVAVATVCLVAWQQPCNVPRESRLNGMTYVSEAHVLLHRIRRTDALDMHYATLNGRKSSYS